MTTQYGAPLTGAQMQRLQDAGLRACGFKMTGESRVDDKGVVTKTYDKYHLPADHAAYTLLEAGWLDGRNVALWFGGEKAPDDWDGNHVMFRNGLATWGGKDGSWEHAHGFADIIAYTRKTEGLTTHADRVLADAERAARRVGGELGHNELWGDVVASSEECPACEPTPCYCDVMAQDPNAPQNEYPPANEKLKEAVRLSREMTVQPETVTIAKMTEAEIIASWQDSAGLLLHFANKLGLIKEPTREERFWVSQPNGGAHVADDVKAWVREALEFERD